MNDEILSYAVKLKCGACGEVVLMAVPERKCSNPKCAAPLRVDVIVPCAPKPEPPKTPSPEPPAAEPEVKDADPVKRGIRSFLQEHPEEEFEVEE